MTPPMPAVAYLYELLGLVYYVMFAVMGTRRFRARFSTRSRLLTFFAAVALVGNIPGHYATLPLGVAMMFAFAAAALVSSAMDARRS